MELIIYGNLSLQVKYDALKVCKIPQHINYCFFLLYILEGCFAHCIAWSWKHMYRHKVYGSSIFDVSYLEIKTKKTARAIYTHLKLCLATATHNFKWVKIALAFLILVTWRSRPRNPPMKLANFTNDHRVICYTSLSHIRIWIFSFNWSGYVYILIWEGKFKKPMYITSSYRWFLR